MIFKKISDTKPVADYLYKSIREKLDQNKSVLWLVPGGSSLPIAIEVAKRLGKLNLHKLSVGLTDERYGAIGHRNSNWAELEEASFDLPGANLVPVLINRPLAETVQLYEKKLFEALNQSDYKIAFGGIGADGHAFGVKPKSPAVFSAQLVSGYRGEDFIRITLTPVAIKKMDEIVIYAVGEAKHPVLDQLEEALPVVTQPAQALKQVKKLTIYNDYKGEPA